ncbi:MAG TPA: hypothetical protein DGD08_17510 [Gemmatimonas aurantiaca]|nr:Ig-like domain-containing protein [Gemmatimonas aurantiaca]HCT59001.1 hypothetical protein [Gemmatimonas aurantiaca]
MSIMPIKFSRVTTLAAALFASSLLGACADDGSTGPGTGTGQQARLMLSASLQQTAAASEEVRIATSYILLSGGTTSLSSQSISLTGSSQTVPVGIDLSNCLRDSQRAGLNGVAPGADECVVQLSVQLYLDGLPVDQHQVGPLSLRPGVTTTIPNTLQLNDIAEVRLTAPTENVVGVGQPLRMETARTMALTMTILDRQQRPVSGRVAAWSSSSPNVATVSATGVVTAVTVGTTRITADVGGRQAVADVRVVPPPALLRVSSAGLSGTGTVSSSPAGLNCVVNGTVSTGTCAFTFPGDVQVVLTATPTVGTELIGWSGDCSGTQGAACTVSMNQERNVGVVFRALRSLNVTATGTGVGTVNSDLGGISCFASMGSVSGTCANTFFEGTVVTLNAIAGGNSTFGGWTGDCAGTTSTVCQVTMNAARTVTARFDAPVPVSITGTGNGNGTVSSLPIGLSCTLQGAAGLGACTGLFAEGATVTLTAIAASQSSFRGWTGCATTSGNTCTFVVNGPSKTISVQFDPPATLSVVPTGSGDGQVFGGTAIACARINLQNTGRCISTLANGSTITLTALPDNFSTFIGWTGACSGNGSCLVTMDQPKSVGAIFNRRQVSLTLTLSGPGFGTVRVNDSYTCSLAEGESERVCQTFVDLNRDVTLTASPGFEQSFSAFGGACASSSTSCTFTANSAASVSASFGEPTVTVVVTAPSNATGAGMVSAAGTTLDCSLEGTTSSNPAYCKATATISELEGALVLQADPDATSTFAGWGGACASSGTSTTCVITNPTGNIDVTALFVAVPSVNVSVTLTGLGTGSVTASGSGWSRTCERSTGSSSPPTSCNWLIPIGQSFDVSMSGAGSWTSSSGQLCHQASSFCTVPMGITSNNSLSVEFFPYSPLRKN